MKVAVVLLLAVVLAIGCSSVAAHDEDLDALVDQIERDVAEPSQDIEETVDEEDDDDEAVNTDATTLASLRAYLEDCARRGVRPKLAGGNVEQMASKIWDEEAGGILRNKFKSEGRFKKWAGCKKNNNNRSSGNKRVPDGLSNSALKKEEKKEDKKRERGLKKILKKEKRKARKDLRKERKLEKRAKGGRRKEEKREKRALRRAVRKEKNKERRELTKEKRTEREIKGIRNVNRRIREDKRIISGERGGRRRRSSSSRRSSDDAVSSSSSSSSPSSYGGNGVVRVVQWFRLASNAPVSKFRSPKFRQNCEKRLRVLNNCRKARAHPTCSSASVKKEEAAVKKKLKAAQKNEKKVLNKIKKDAEQTKKKLEKEAKKETKKELKKEKKMVKAEKKAEKKKIDALKKSVNKKKIADKKANKKLVKQLKKANKKAAAAVKAEKKELKKEAKLAKKITKKEQKAEKKVEKRIKKAAKIAAQKVIQKAKSQAKNAIAVAKAKGTLPPSAAAAAAASSSSSTVRVSSDSINRLAKAAQRRLEESKARGALKKVKSDDRKIQALKKRQAAVVRKAVSNAVRRAVRAVSRAFGNKVAAAKTEAASKVVVKRKWLGMPAHLRRKVAAKRRFRRKFGRRFGRKRSSRRRGGRRNRRRSLRRRHWAKRMRLLSKKRRALIRKRKALARKRRALARKLAIKKKMMLLKKIKVVSEPKIDHPKARAAKLINWFKKKPGRLAKFKVWLAKRSKSGKTAKTSKSLLDIINKNKRKVVLRKLQKNISTSKPEEEETNNFRLNRWAKRSLRKGFRKLRRKGKFCNWICQMKKRIVDKSQTPSMKRGSLSAKDTTEIKYEIAKLHKRLQALKKVMDVDAVSGKTPSFASRRSYRKAEREEKELESMLDHDEKPVDGKCGWWCRLMKRRAQRAKEEQNEDGNK